jgi:hypothetical protein
MLSSELLDELHQLSRAEKLHLVQLLVNDLAAEEDTVFSLGSYPVYTPYGNEEAARILYEALQAAQSTYG